MNKRYTPMFKLICRFLKDNNIPYRDDIFDKMNGVDPCLSLDWFIVRYIEKIPLYNRNMKIRTKYDYIWNEFLCKNYAYIKHIISVEPHYLFSTKYKWQLQDEKTFDSIVTSLKSQVPTCERNNTYNIDLEYFIKTLQ